MLLFLSVSLMDIKKQKEEGNVTKPAEKSEGAAPAKNAEAEKSTSVGKGDGEISVPASKAVVSLLFLFIISIDFE